jgi:hypothetical protein
MGKKTSKRNQKLYKMKGCSKNKSRKHGRHHHGGSEPLAYTGEKMQFSNNPFLAYTGKGGSGSNNSLNPSAVMPTNTMPNTGPVFQGVSTIPTNKGLMQRGGNCGSSTCSTINMTGGSCGCGQLLTGGGITSGGKKQKGGTWAPQGLIGKPWTPSPSGWPGVNGMSRNYLDYNQYKVDPQTAMINLGPNFPFLKGGKKHKSNKKSKKQRGGALSNFLMQDFVNLGRQAQFGFGSAYNGINGFPAPVNPLPWKGQFPNGALNIRNALL